MLPWGLFRGRAGPRAPEGTRPANNLSLAQRDRIELGPYRTARGHCVLEPRAPWAFVTHALQWTPPSPPTSGGRQVSAHIPSPPR